MAVCNLILKRHVLHVIDLMHKFIYLLVSKVRNKGNLHTTSFGAND